MLAVPPESSILATMTLCWWNQRQLHIPILVNQFVPYQSFLLVIMMSLAKSFLIIFIRWLEKNQEVLKVIFFFLFLFLFFLTLREGLFSSKVFKLYGTQKGSISKNKKTFSACHTDWPLWKKMKNTPSFSCFYTN